MKERLDKIELYFKYLLTSLFAAISLRLGVLDKLLWLFIAAVILDYSTGVFSAVYHRQLSSGIGLRGIVKKVGECLVIAAAFIVDEVVTLTGSRLGVLTSTKGAIAVVVTIWLILNELISILENLKSMDVPLPSFLPATIKALRKQTEDEAENQK